MNYLCENFFDLRRTFILNLGLLLFLNLLIKPFWIFGIDMEVQGLVGAKEYGMYASLFSTSIILNILLDLGITNFNNRNIARHSHLLQKYFSNIVVLKLGLGLLYAIVCFAVGILLNWTNRELLMLAFLAFNQFLLAFILYLRSNISGLHLFKTDSIISITDRTIMIVLCGLLLLYKKDGFKIEWFVYCQTIGYILTSIIAFLIVLKKAKFFKLTFNWRFLLTILKQTYPYATLVLFMALYLRTDMVMLKEMLDEGDKQAGIYAQSFRVLDAVSIFAYLFANLLLPIFSRMLKNKESVSQLVKLSYSLLIVPVFIFSITSFFYSRDFMNMLYSDHLDESELIYQILILGFIPIASTYVFGTLLTANKSLKALNIITGSGMVLNVALNAILIPEYFAAGAAIASLITQFLTSVAQMIASSRILSLKTDYMYVFKVVLFILVLLGVNVLFKGLFSSWYISASVAISCGIVTAVLLRLIHVKSITMILKDRGNA